MFDVPAAKVLYADIRERMDNLEAEFETLWPAVRTEVNRIQYRIRKDGQLYPNVAKTIADHDTERDGSELVIYQQISFNPGSTKDRVEELWAAGWQPTEKTDSHYKFTMKGRPGKPWGKKAKLTEEHTSITMVGRSTKRTSRHCLTMHQRVLLSWRSGSPSTGGSSP
jgi:hypothetical protein